MQRDEAIREGPALPIGGAGRALERAPILFKVLGAASMIPAGALWSSGDVRVTPRPGGLKGAMRYTARPHPVCVR